MIRAIDGKGVNRADAVCDECGRIETVTCDYSRESGGAWIPNEGQIIKKISGHGWALVKARLHCPACEAKRKAAAAARRESDMQAKVEAKTATVREASGPQKRLIILALEDAYDDGAKRYKGAATDASVAQGLGDGIMPGWVSAIREEMFGPAGNEEIEAIKREIAAMVESANATAAAMLKRIEAVEQASDRRVKA